MSDSNPAEPPRSVHTNTLPRLLSQLGVSLAVSTYQAGKLFFIRDENGVANTHFQAIDVPMGVAFDRGRLAVGTSVGVWEFHNQPAVAGRVDTTGQTDAYFLPRYLNLTGHIAIHEVAYGGDELWAVNTKFSCLCTFDRAHSFVPRWRPPFVTRYSATDRCHLNGFCFENGEPRYATALGRTDTDAGWRANKAAGGVLMEVPSGRVVAGGLSMPHSPRLHAGKLWVCESGKGSLATVDRDTGELTTVGLVPGFTRGLDFVGPYAFVGLSQVRESAVFSGIPITDRLTPDERACGVWVIDTRTGQSVAFLRFEAGVREVFAVTVLPHRWPDLVSDLTDTAVAGSYVLPDTALADVA